MYKSTRNPSRSAQDRIFMTALAYSRPPHKDLGSGGRASGNGTSAFRFNCCPQNETGQKLGLLTLLLENKQCYSPAVHTYVQFVCTKLKFKIKH